MFNEKKALKILEEEGFQEPRYFWLSFCDPERPVGEQFLGVVVTKACGFLNAVKKAHELGINPGGGVKSWEIPEELINEEWKEKLEKMLDQLWSKKELEERGIELERG